MTIDEEISKAAAECDAHFHHAQPELIAERGGAGGATDALKLQAQLEALRTPNAPLSDTEAPWPKTSAA
jgi:hypothetical protein